MLPRTLYLSPRVIRKYPIREGSREGGPRLRFTSNFNKTVLELKIKKFVHVPLIWQVCFEVHRNVVITYIYSRILNKYHTKRLPNEF
jgi:hypothetical protein